MAGGDYTQTPGVDMNEDLTTGDKVKTKEEFKFKKRGKINKKEEKEIRRTQKSLTSWLIASRRKDNINTDMDVNEDT